ncbi:hypothetical protein [Inquilinus sp. Marseille-Q2685]|nr:hypothetical protein [Inquilinus sp. Marseille-Q2685]
MPFAWIGATLLGAAGTAVSAPRGALVFWLTLRWAGALDDPSSE